MDTVTPFFTSMYDNVHHLNIQTLMPVSISTNIKTLHFCVMDGMRHVACRPFF